MRIFVQVAVVGERRCGKTSLAEALRRSAAAREAAAAACDSSTDVDDLAGSGSGWCRLDVVDLSAGRHLDVYGRSLEVDAYILAFDITSIQAAGSAYHNGTAAALASRHAARLQMWLQALYEVLQHIQGGPVKLHFYLKLTLCLFQIVFTFSLRLRHGGY